MSCDFASYGRRLNSMTEAAIADVREPSEHADFLSDLDNLLLHYTKKALKREQIVHVSRGVLDNTVSLIDLTENHQRFLHSNYSQSVQQSRGAWFLPDDARLRINLLNRVGNFSSYEYGFAQHDDCRARLDQTPDALFIWSSLTPFLEALLAPLEMRGRLALAGTKTRTAQIQAWSDVDQFFQALKLDVSKELSKLTYGSGWSKLRVPERNQIKSQFLKAVQERITTDSVRRFRLLAVRPLVARYYLKAKHQAPLMRNVLTKPLERILSGYFGGDWLRFVNYLGETPNQEERIVTALPKVSLLTQDRQKIPDIASTHGVQVAEVERILSLLWNNQNPTSPVEQRIAVLKQYWNELEAIQARQASGMHSLWGLVDERLRIEREAEEPSVNDSHRPNLYRLLLSDDIQTEISLLWSTKAMKKWPDRLVTEPKPIGRLQDILGPALKFWHGCALTVWFISEEQLSRTDISGLTKYYRTELAQLEAIECPVNNTLFSDLLMVEPLLRKKTTFIENTGSTTIRDLTFRISSSQQRNRERFQYFRDIVRAHMQEWTETYFEKYLQTRWQSDIQEVGRKFYQLLELHGKQPSPRQIAPFSMNAANRWFGGDIGALFNAFGEKTPVAPTYMRILPSEPQAFIQSVFEALGGELMTWSEACRIKDDEKRERVWRKHEGQVSLANLSIHYVQVREAVGRAPTLSEFSKSKIQWWLQFIDTDSDKAWSYYSKAIEHILQSYNENSVLWKPKE